MTGFITDPFVSECYRFVLDPIKDYASTKETNDMIQYNGLDEELVNDTIWYKYLIIY